MSGRLFQEAVKQPMKTMNQVGDDVDLGNATLGCFNRIEGRVTLGKNVVIGNHCTLLGTITIGDGTVIDNNVTILNTVRIGAENRIFSGTAIGYPAQHTATYDHGSKVISIGDGNTFRENITVHLPYSRDVTEIGSHGYFMANTHFPHDVIVADHVITSNNTAIGGHSSIGQFAFIGLNSCIHQFSRIGAYAMVGMGSAITKDVLPFHTAVGSANSVKLKLNEIGFQRNYQGPITLEDLREARANIQATRSLVGVTRSEPLQTLLCEFEAGSKRGVYL